VDFEFSKLHGAGNDFIVVDDSDGKMNRSPFFISNLCRRHTGVGADGMIFLSKDSAGPSDCRMYFFNNDGNSAGMCGNGLRCAAKFASKYMFDKQKRILFQTDSGLLNTEILDNDLIRAEIPVMERPEKVFPEGEELYYVNTGVPHLVCINNDIKNLDVRKHGSYWRRHSFFEPEGVNVDFIQITEFSGEQIIQIRTYERGLECESNACGTGIAAAALSLFAFCEIYPPFTFLTRSNDRIVIDFSSYGNKVFEEKRVLLTGNAVEVYRGTLINKDLSCEMIR